MAGGRQLRCAGPLGLVPEEGLNGGGEVRVISKAVSSREISSLVC